MAFEGTPKQIPIKGIARAGADNAVDAGTMNEVIGLEYKDGSYVPYCATDKQSCLPASAIYVRVHHTNWQDNMLIIANNGTTTNVYWMPKATFDAKNTSGTLADWTLISGTDGVTEIENVGNLICTNTLNYFIWNNAEGTYDAYLNSTYGDDSSASYYDLPSVSFRVTDKSGDSETEHGSSGEILFKKSTTISNTSKYTDVSGNTWVKMNLFDDATLNSVAGVAQAAQYSVQENGRLYGYCMAVFAYRLLNGDFILASNPALLAPPAIKYDGLHTDAAIVPTDAAEYDSATGRLSFGYGFPGDDETWNVGDRYSNNDVYIWKGSSDKSTKSIFEIPGLFGYYHNGWGNSSQFLVVGAASNSLQYKVSSDIPQKYEGLISGLCIFLSPQVNPYKEFKRDNVIYSDKYNIGKDDTSSYYTAGYQFALKDIDDVLTEIKELKNFYLVKEIPYDDIAQSTGWEIADLTGKLGDTLYTLEALPVDAYDHRQNVSGHIDTYNSRFHLFNYTQKLFRGFPFSEFVFQPGGKGQKMEQYLPTQITVNYSVAITIKSAENVSTVVRTQSGYLMEIPIIGPIITYPDSNATKMELYIEYTLPSSSETVKCKYNIPLKSNQSIGYSYYITPNLDPIDFSDVSTIPSDWSITIFVSFPTEKNVYMTYPNGMKASDAQYPVHFPAANTYQIGKKEIVGLAVLSVALSQETFGQYPLMVLCGDGIYSLAVNSQGTTAYTNVTPFPSREVCVNRNSICELDGIVIFASTKGLMMIDGSQSATFCEALNGEPRNLPTSARNNSDGLYLYHLMTTDARITNLSSAISDIDFIDFVQDADTYVSYISKKNKVLVYNKNYDYAYFIDIQSRNATKLNMQILFDNNDYPYEEYYTTDLHKHSFDYLSASGAASHCLLQTRPMRLDQGLKSGFRVVLDGYFNLDSATNQWVDIIVLGSLDTKNWHTIGGKEKALKDGGFYEFGAKVYRTSYKYIMVIAAGQLSADSHIDNIQLTDKDKYNTKLKQ